MVAAAGATPALATEFRGATEPKRVYILARKVLLRNARIFKQAVTLTRAGYVVTVIGIMPSGGLPWERRDGYTIVRLPLDPLYARLPRRLRRGARSAHRLLVRIPRRFLRAARGVRRWRRWTSTRILRLFRRPLG